ncbi:MAG: ABC transporter permease [Sphingomonadales bacterium]|nr:ABC transporter permease [Sphingomonadales bacterium]MBU3991671.1 ABC transporter permease [Alphaproteobacteria bacterium]
MTWRIVLAIARVEWLRLIRSRMTFTLLLLVPALQVVLFGLAIRPEAARVSVAVAAPTPESAASVVGRLDADGRFRRIGAVGAPGSAANAVRQGVAQIGLEIPAMRSFANPGAPIVAARLIIDASRPTLTSAAEARLLARYWQDKAESLDAGGPEIRIERLFNPDARADWSFLPALVGVTTMIGMIMLGSLAVSREREGGTWETLQSLPLRPVVVMIGKLLPGTVLGSAQGILVLIIALTAFAVPATGSITALIALTPLFAAAHLSIGYAISCAARTQLAALQGGVAFYLPAMLLSGFLYPFETLPRWAQIIGNAFPLSHFIRAAHGATLRGDSALSVLAHGLPMAAALPVAVALALAIQRRSR